MSSSSSRRLAEQVQLALYESGLLRPDTHFRETSRGGVEVTKIDIYGVARNRALLHRLSRLAAIEDMNFEIRPGRGLLMQPLGRSSMEVVMNPRRSTSRLRRKTTTRRR